MFLTLTIFCALSFFVYGLNCLVSLQMAREFERYGLPQYRKLTGILQLLAVGGLLLGIPYPMAGLFAAAGLALQMLAAVGVRLRIRDNLFQCLPATAYLLVSAWLCSQHGERLATWNW